MWPRVAVLILALALALGVTGPKLYTMALIKGWLPGGVVTAEVIAQKGIDKARRLREDDSYWVSWEKGEARTWDKRERVSPDDWQDMQVGDAIELVRLPGDPHAYL